MPTHLIIALPNFLAYFGVAAAMLALFLVLYVNITPYAEIQLIRANNAAAGVTLSGTIIGFTMPVANAVAHSDTLLDLIFWGLLAGALQLLAFGAVRLTLPRLTEQIPSGHMGPAAFLASISIAVGLLNAACMAY